MRVLLAVNANSRRGREALDPALQAFERAGFRVRQETAPKSRGIPDLLRAHAAHADAIVLAGGDGTANAAAPALLEADLPVGLLPLGTANDLARTLAIPTDLAAAAQVIVAGRTRRIDVGDVNGRPFFNVAHLGLGATWKREVGHAVKKRWGRFGYAVAGLRALRGLRPFVAEIAGGETARVRTVQVSVGNGRHYGGIATIAEDARLDDGLLHLVSIETANPLRFLLMYRALLAGRHGARSGVRALAGTGFDIRTRRPKAIVADGKTLAETPARFTLRAGALRFFAPPLPSSD
jgi:diacylglycerol kinase (ATP)